MGFPNRHKISQWFPVLWLQNRLHTVYLCDLCILCLSNSPALSLIVLQFPGTRAHPQGEKWQGETGELGCLTPFCFFCLTCHLGIGRFLLRSGPETSKLCQRDMSQKIQACYSKRGPFRSEPGEKQGSSGHLVQGDLCWQRDEAWERPETSLKLVYWCLLEEEWNSEFVNPEGSWSCDKLEVELGPIFKKGTSSGDFSLQVQGLLFRVFRVW